MHQHRSEHSIGIVAGFSGFAVTDIDAAQTFYQDTLGLEVASANMGLLRISLPGGTSVIVYPKPDHVPAGFTILNFDVHNLDAAVSELTERGVEFLRYDEREQEQSGIARGNGHGPDIAWFTDPSGNILSLLHSV